MFRNIHSSTSILVGLIFFVVIVAGSLLYSWHVRRTTKIQLAKTRQVPSPLENKNETQIELPTAQPVETQTPNVLMTPEENTEAAPIDDTDVIDLTNAFLPDGMVSEEAPAEDMPVSPFGFGPYPELPADWPEPDVIWPCISANHELLVRVEIKLWKQGIKTKGSVMDNGLVYPNIPGTVYIKWGEYNGPKGPVRYLASIRGSDRKRLRTIADAKRKHESFTEADFPRDLKILTFEEGGIDPYQFLDLPKE